MEMKLVEQWSLEFSQDVKFGKDSSMVTKKLVGNLDNERVMSLLEEKYWEG